MDFGKLQDISQVDFRLPENDFLLFEKHPPTAPLAVLIGPPVWANKDWVGKIYPNNAKEIDFLQYYSRQFNTIELNSTHYIVPNDATVQRWQSSVPADFRFCPKFPQAISHERQLIGAQELTDYFIQQVSKLSPNLGISFLQLSPVFSTQKKNVLLNYLENIPRDFRMSVEFRHPSWFSDQKTWEATASRLHELGIGTVITDVAGRRDVLHMTLTTPELTLRFVGNELDPTDYSRTDAWVERIARWYEQGLERATIFIHCGDNRLAPELVNYWIDRLNATLSLTLRKATIQPTVVQGTLF